MPQPASCFLKGKKRGGRQVEQQLLIVGVANGKEVIALFLMLVPYETEFPGALKNIPVLPKAFVLTPKG